MTVITDLSTLGQAIRRMRRAAHLTQAQLGKRMGVGQTTVGRWENGVACPSTDAIESLARFLKVDTEEVRRLVDRTRDEQAGRDPEALDRLQDVVNTLAVAVETLQAVIERMREGEPRK